MPPNELHASSPDSDCDCSNVPPLGNATAGCPPLANVLASFMNMDFELASGMAAPRPENELLAAVCIDRLSLGLAAPIALDMCCGCGHLAVAVAHRTPLAQIWGCDPDTAAVDIAWRNVMRFALQRRISIVQSDLFENIRNIGFESRVDLAFYSRPGSLHNSAYADSDFLAAAQYDSPDSTYEGISLEQRLIGEALDFLKPGGWLIFELESGQEQQIAVMIQQADAYAPAQFILDMNGIPRIAMTRKRKAER